MSRGGADADRAAGFRYGVQAGKAADVDYFGRRGEA